MSAITLFYCSPRKHGNSATLGNSLAQGVVEAGGVIEKVFLHGMNMNPCMACDNCQGSDEVICSQNDDMQKIYPLIEKSQIIVLASPIYCFSMPAQLKLLLDRCYAFGGPGRIWLKDKRLVALFTYGDSRPEDSGVLNAIGAMKDLSRFMQMELVDILHGTAHLPGEIQNNVELMRATKQLGKSLVVS